MKKIIIFISFFCWSVALSQTPQIDCLKQLNTDLKNEILNLVSKNKEYSYDEKIKLVLDFKVKRNGALKELKVVSENLREYGIDSIDIINYLRKRKYPCLYEIYLGWEKGSKINFIFKNKFANN